MTKTIGQIKKHMKNYKNHMNSDKYQLKNIKNRLNNYKHHVNNEKNRMTNIKTIQQMTKHLYEK